jgi:hypothetical protein
MRPVSRAHPVSFRGGDRLEGATDGAADAQEIDVPAHDEQRVRNTHNVNITCNVPDCPTIVHYADGPTRYILGHVWRNATTPGVYSGSS